MRQNNIRVAITGGIGSGKTTVAKIINEQGYKVISCDEVYEELLCDRAFTDKLLNCFGTEIFYKGKVDKKKLAEIVFSDNDKLVKLNGLTHPAIMAEVMKRTENTALSFCEVPLLFENGFEKFFDEIIVVMRNERERVKSVVKRDSISEKDVYKRINAQLDYKNGNFTEYYVIHNTLGFTDLQKKTIKILENLKNKIS